MKGYVCVRTIFGLFNGLVWVLGCGVVAVAIWLRFAYRGYVSLLPQHGILSLDAVVLIGGVILFIAAFLGCCGAWCKNQCLLTSYFLLVALLCGAEVACGVLGFLFSETISSTLRQELLSGIRNHYNVSGQDEGLTLAWERVHYQFNCCGVSSYEDWYNISAWPSQNFVPHSCCIPEFQHYQSCGTQIPEEISMFTQKGCYQQVETWFQDRLHFVGIVAFIVAFLQLFGLVSSMVLCCTVRQRSGFKTYKAEVSPRLL